MFKEPYKKTTKEIRVRGIRVRLIDLTKVMDGIQNIILCQPGNVMNH